MAVDEGLLTLQREDLSGRPGIREKKMFGGVAFMLDGNMLCGVMSRSAMYRVGKAAQAQALDLGGVTPMEFSGRTMGGFVEADEDAMAEDAVRLRLLDMALEFVGSLPPK